MNKNYKVDIAPLRTLPDFILEPARFQLPPFGDLTKWNYKVLQNLMYYQSNYFILYIISLIFISLLRPSQMFFGILTFASGFVLIFFMITRKIVNNMKKVHWLVSLPIISFIGYMVAYHWSSLATSLLGILLPIVAIFIHASSRMRSIKNRIINKVEWLGLKKSPMGFILDFIGVELDLVS